MNRATGSPPALAPLTAHHADGARNWSNTLFEFFSNSALVPVSVLLLELLLEGRAVLTTPDPYVLLLAALTQTALLASPRVRPAAELAACNLAGFVLYALIGGWMEGPKFLLAWHHVLYGVYSGIFAVLAVLLRNPGARHANLFLLADSFFRATVPLAMYAAFEAAEQGGDFSASAFWSTQNHFFLFLNAVLLGILLGLARVGEHGARTALADLSRQLYRISYWTIGEAALTALLGGGAALARVERVIVFIDIRGFTAWSETVRPEGVVEMLNQYYASVAAAAASMRPLRIKFSADEAMLVCAHAPSLTQLLSLAASASAALGQHNLGVGIGLHRGAVVEGLLGTGEHKVYDVIGDAANIASRLCAAAGRSEIVLSATTRTYVMGIADRSGQTESLAIKGKTLPLDVIRIGV